MSLYYTHFLIPDPSNKDFIRFNDLIIHYDELKDHEERYNQSLECWIKKKYEVDRNFFKKEEEKNHPDLNVQFIRQKNLSVMKRKISIVGDIHGDINAFLFPLIQNEIVTIDAITPFIYLESEKGERVDPIIYQGERVLIKIPHLHLNLDSFAGEEKIIYLGDYLDRGEYSIEVFYLVVDLIRQLKETGLSKDLWPIDFILGNHELMMIKGKFHYFNQHEFSYDLNKRARFFSIKVRPNVIQRILIDLTSSGDFTFSLSYNGIFFSHAYLCPYLIDSLRTHFKDERGERLLQLGGDLISGHDEIFDGLKKDHIFFKNQTSDRAKLISDLINNISREKINTIKGMDFFPLDLLEDDPILNSDFGLTWVRMLFIESKESGEILYDPDYAPLRSLQMISGHQGLTGGLPENYGGAPYHLCLDISQSHAYYEDGKGKISFFELNKFRIEQVILKFL